MEVLQNFKNLFFDVWDKGISGVNISEILIDYIDENGWITENLYNISEFSGFDVLDIEKVLKPYKKKINSLFHFGEFSRIYQSFLHMNKCIQSNSIGSVAVFNFCL